MRTVFVNGTIFTPNEQIASSALIVEDEKIVEVARVDPKTVESQVIDAKGMYIIPGLIDIHIHGGQGCDTMDASEEALDSIAGFLAAHGVTSFLPTTVTASAQDTMRAVQAVASHPKPSTGAGLLGIHLEGPYLDHQYSGAQPAQHLREPDLSEYNAWLKEKAVRLITIAPELPGAAELIQTGVQKDIRFAVGHSAASYEQVLEATRRGLDQVTHIFNGMAPLHHRTPGIVGAALTEDCIYTQLIADGIHVNPVVIKLLLKAKGVNRIILISDAIRAAGMADGEYALGDQTVFVEAGTARTRAGGLAGSTLTLEKAVSNMMRFTGLSLQDVLPMATRVPAEALGLENKGIIASGYDADIVILDQYFQVHLTMVEGRVVYQRKT